MLYRVIMFLAGVLCLGVGPAVANASVVTGSFSGTVSSGSDTTGVFGSVGGDLTNDTITGTFSYDSTMFSQVVASGTNTAVGTGLGALTVTVTISGFSHTFTDQTSSSIFLDDGSVSGNNEMTLNTLNQQSAGSTVNESFTLDADDPLTAFITGTDLVQNFTESPFISNRSFQILDIGPNVTADGAFTINTLALNGAQTTVPEPASALLLLVGVVGIAMRRLTTARAG